MHIHHNHKDQKITSMTEVCWVQMPTAQVSSQHTDVGCKSLRVVPGAAGGTLSCLAVGQEVILTLLKTDQNTEGATSSVPC